MVLWVWSIFHARLDLSFWALLLIFGGVMWSSYGFAIGIQQLKTSLLNIRLLFFGWAAVCTWVVFKLVLFPSQTIGILSPFTLAYRYIIEENDIPSQVWLAIVTGLIIIRAVKLAQFHVSSYSVRNSFQIGLVFLLLYGLFGINSQLPQPVLPVAVFMGISLIGLSSAKLAEMSRQRGGSRIDLKPVWLLLILAVTVGTLLLGASLTALIHWQSAGITNLAVFILAILATILIIPFALIGLLLTMIMIPFIRILQRIGIFQLFKLDPDSLGIESNLQPILGLQHQLPTAPIFVMIILIILLLVLGYLVGRVRRKKVGSNSGQTRWDQRSIMVIGLGGNGWLRRKILSAFDQFGSRMRIPNVRRAWTAARIRRVYARFLDDHASAWRIAGDIPNPVGIPSQGNRNNAGISARDGNDHQCLLAGSLWGDPRR